MISRQAQHAPPRKAAPCSSAVFRSAGKPTATTATTARSVPSIPAVAKAEDRRMMAKTMTGPAIIPAVGVSDALHEPITAMTVPMTAKADRITRRWRSGAGVSHRQTQKAAKTAQLNSCEPSAKAIASGTATASAARYPSVRLKCSGTSPTDRSSSRRDVRLRAPARPRRSAAGSAGLKGGFRVPLIAPVARGPKPRSRGRGPVRCQNASGNAPPKGSLVQGHVPARHSW